MGLETEYSVSGRRTNGARIRPDEACAMLTSEARAQAKWLPDACQPGSGIYLENAARFYTEINGTPEWATAEAASPGELAAHDKAAERLLQQFAEAAGKRHRARLTVSKHNNDYLRPDAFTKGNHEAYSVWVGLPCMIEQLLPHLASRTFYAGAGCVSARGAGGFELSQRARHVNCTTGSQTTFDRALFCTRIRKSTDHSPGAGWIRAHIITKDSHRHAENTRLCTGITGLLIHFINQGHTLWRRASLADPVEALRVCSTDPWFNQRVQLSDGTWLKALDIQAEYHAACAELVASGDAPPWGFEIWRDWGKLIEDALADPRRLVGRLDAYTKFALFDQVARGAGVSWEELKPAYAKLNHLHQHYPEHVVQAALVGGGDSLPKDKEIVAAYRNAAKAIDLEGFKVREHLHLAVRLQLLDLKYHELGGLYEDLAARGMIEPACVSEADITRAMHHPPASGRAEARGRIVRENQHQRDAWVVNWDFARHTPSGTLIMMSDPFSDHTETRQETA
jgi:proteasome accessory factor A